MYRLVFEARVTKDLKELDSAVVRQLLRRIESQLAKSPKTVGKPLKGSLKSLWKYRYRDYRVVYRIIDETITILVIAIKHRKDIYEYLERWLE